MVRTSIYQYMPTGPTLTTVRPNQAFLGFDFKPQTTSIISIRRFHLVFIGHARVPTHGILYAYLYRPEFSGPQYQRVQILGYT